MVTPIVFIEELFMDEKIQLGDIIKFSAVGKKIILPGVVFQFDSHSVYIKIDDKEASIPYEIELI